MEHRIDIEEVGLFYLLTYSVRKSFPDSMTRIGERVISKSKLNELLSVAGAQESLTEQSLRAELKRIRDEEKAEVDQSCAKP
jgi:hypothetical protein